MLKNNNFNYISQVKYNDYLNSSSTINLMNYEYNKDSIQPLANKYNIYEGALAGGAIIDHNSNFVINIGGLSNGFAIIKISTTITKIYNLIIDYISNFIDSPLKIDVNNINTGSIYFLPKTDFIKSFTIPIFLKEGINEIKFYGDGINYGPKLKTAWLININSNTNSYDLSEGNLINNAKVRLSTGFVYMIGGPNDGMVILEVWVEKKGIYRLIMEYLSGDYSRNVVININESNNNMYCFPKTSGWSISDIKKFSLYVTLNTGINILKIHGDGINYSPNLKKFIIEKVCCNSKTNTSTIDLPATPIPNVVPTIPSIPSVSNPVTPTISSTPSIPNPAIVTIPNVETISNPITTTFTTSFPISIPISSVNSSIFSAFNTKNNCNSIILNGSAFVKKNFIEGIGGINKGCVLLIIEVPFKGDYDFAIPYVTTDDNKKIKIEVNGINTGVVYNFEKTLSLSTIDEKTKIIKLSLIQGKNVIKIF